MMLHKILALKDRPEYALELRQLLEVHGYIVIGATSIEQAFELLQRESFDMIIVAIHLQDGNVFDFIRSVKTHANPLVRKIPLVCLNLHQRLHAKFLNESLAISARALGANRFITMEQFDAADLWAQIYEMLPGAVLLPTIVSKSTE